MRAARSTAIWWPNVGVVASEPTGPAVVPFSPSIFKRNFISRTFGGAAEVCVKKETVDVPLVVFVTRFVTHFFELGGILHDEEVMPGQARASPAPARMPMLLLLMLLTMPMLLPMLLPLMQILMMPMLLVLVLMMMVLVLLSIMTTMMNLCASRNSPPSLHRHAPRPHLGRDRKDHRITLSSPNQKHLPGIQLTTQAYSCFLKNAKWMTTTPPKKVALKVRTARAGAGEARACPGITSSS